MISRIFRSQFLPSRLTARSGGWERPDPPLMVKYQNRRTLGLVNKFLHRNDGVAPAYIVNDYSNEATLTERYANFFKSSMAFAIFLVPFFLLGWIFGERVPQYIDTGAIDIKKRHARWVQEGKYEQLKKNNPYGIEVTDPIPGDFLYSEANINCNKKHDVVRAQGLTYIQKLISEVQHDMEHSEGSGHHSH